MHRTHFTLVHKRCLCEFMREKMLKFCSVFLVSVLSLLIKTFEGFVSRYVYRSMACAGEGNDSNFSANHSQEEDHLVSKKSTVFLSSENENLKLEKRETDTNGDIAETEGSDCLRSGVIVNSSKYEFMSGKDVCGYFEEPRMDNFVVHEMFVGSSEVLESNDQSLGCDEIPRKEVSVEETNLQEFDQESDSFSFCFKLFDSSIASNDGLQGCVSKLEGVDQEKADNAFEICCIDEKINSADSEDFGDGEKDLIMEDDILEGTYAVELLPANQCRSPESNWEFDAAGDDISMPNVDQNVESTEKTLHEGYDSRNWMSSFLEESDQITNLENLDFELNFDHTERTEELDDEYIELEPQTLIVKHVRKRIYCGDADEEEGSHKQDITPNEEVMPQLSSQEHTNCWDSDDTDDDEDELDALLEHQLLVQQMKMELKNCSRIRSLPTISEEECETLEQVDDLKPLEIDTKIEYKDVVQEIQKFYKSYIERMRKLDILNYQTLHAISFLQLKVSEVLTEGMKRADLVSRIRPYKGQRIYADPMHKSIIEMHRDLELVYVGHLCLSWEVLRWLYAKAQELLGYDSQGSHSYNRSAEEFQQFQVLMQRFIEDEPFQGQRIQNYVKNRCTIKCLLQVPTIKDDSLKTKKETRDNTDAVSLKMLAQTIRESMLIFQEFLFADKRSTNATRKGIQETKPHLQDPPLDSKLLTDIISSLHKKETKIKEHMRSQNCIVKKLKKQQESEQVDDGMLTCQVELRLVARVLRLSRLSTDQLVWCQSKVKNINFVGRKVHVEPSFLLFPC